MFRLISLILCVLMSLPPCWASVVLDLGRPAPEVAAQADFACQLQSERPEEFSPGQGLRRGPLPGNCLAEKSAPSMGAGGLPLVNFGPDQHGWQWFVFPISELRSPISESTTRPDGATVEIVYNDDGDRMSQRVVETNGFARVTRFLTDRNNLTGYSQVVEEQDGLGNVACVYSYGLDLISMERTNTLQPQLRFYQYDGHGTVRALTDAAGFVTDQYEYDAYGILIERHAANALGTLVPVSVDAPYTLGDLRTENPYLYCGEYFEGAVVTYMLRARMYHSSIGAFLTFDEDEGVKRNSSSLHKYLYGNVDPVQFADPSGRRGALVAIGTAITVASIAYAAGNFAINPSWATFGALVLEAATLGYGSKAKAAYMAGLKALNIVRSTSASSRYMRALGKSASFFKALKYKMVIPVGLYGEMRDAFKGLGFAIHHLNQTASFKKIPRSLGISIPLKGRTSAPGTQHWIIHCFMDNFWASVLDMRALTASDYNDGLVEAMVGAGLSLGDARESAALTVKQAIHFGYFGGGETPVRPKRIIKRGVPCR